MEKYVLYFDEIDKTQIPYVGGKGSNLGEMTRMGFPVPCGFCISTSAYKAFILQSSKMNNLLNQLDFIRYDDLEQISTLGLNIRSHMESMDIPEEIKSCILEAWNLSGHEKAYAVRSSATAEDLPSASFAGQQDTYLNVKGQEQLIEVIKKCWSSLFTDRAISYRAKNSFSHRSVFLSVVVQQMIFPEVSGIMFTADPITGRRNTLSINASFGLGEALVSGLVTADLYQVKAGKIIKKHVSQKKIETCPIPEGGTVTKNISLDRQQIQALTDEKILELATLGEKIKNHYRTDQDIEWCLENDKFYIVQSRPITSLYPVPKVYDNKVHILFSFGHVQMMTEAIKPLGISVLRTIFPFSKSSPETESSILLEAGNRLFVDLSQVLQYKSLRKVVGEFLPNADVMMAKALNEYMKREEFKAGYPGKRLRFSHIQAIFPLFSSMMKTMLFSRVENRIDEVNRVLACHIKESREKLQHVSGHERIIMIRQVVGSILPDLFRLGVVINIGAGMISYKLIEALCKKWLGDASLFSGISKSPPGNVTTEMGLFLGDTADIIRQNPEVVKFLKQADDKTFWSGLKKISGGEEAYGALFQFFEKYGMRCTGEIDITRPRWRESPTQIVPSLLSRASSPRPGQHRLDFESGRKESECNVESLLQHLRRTPFGFFKVKIMGRLIKVHRSVIGIREHPKYHLIQIFDVVKQSILEETNKLVKVGLLDCPEDIYWFSLQEIEELMKTRKIDRNIINVRKEQFERYSRLTPPRVITSEGEVITSRLGSDVPKGALSGSPASAGIAEGRARVVLKLEDAKLEKGDILVTPYTDPAWTPLFPLTCGLVTEVGGLMTHGAVVAREYGIPAVVGVDKAAEVIKDGAFIRVNGTEGYIEILKK